MRELLRDVARDLDVALGDNLRGLYLYGSVTTDYYQPGESDINLVAIVRDESEHHELRQAARPVWEKYSDQLKQPPLLARQSTLARHMQLFSNFGYNLAQNSRLLHGEPNLLGPLPDRSPAEFLSHLADEIMEVSVALAPNLLPPDVAERYQIKLRSLARRLLKRHIKPEETAVDLFAAIQDYLSRKITVLSVTQLLPPPAPSTTPLPGLYAIYKKELGRIVLVFNQLTIPQITATDWTRIADQLTDRCAGLHVTTSVQLRLLTKLERPLDMLFQRYTLDWGKNPLANLKPALHYSLRHAARLPSEIAVNKLPQDYLAAPDEAVNKLVHDYQNRLLNIQLENELLYRMGYLDQFVPSIALPGPEAPNPQRVKAIFSQLDQWCDFYYTSMKQAVSGK
ncbi:MAG: hypothetical protein R6X32_20245 [Chloroflexota bacterium]|jgi:hypothetical protein